MVSWPKHSDGRPMRLGEMSRAQAAAQFKAAAQRVAVEFSNPLMQEKLAAVLRGESVKQ